jgi:PAS domain S-box-containing protein
MSANPSDHVPPVELSPSSERTIAERVEQELKQCLDHAAEGLHWVGPDGTILWANQTELNLLGYTPEEYIGHNIAEFHVDQPVIEDILRRLTNGETLRDYEARVRAKDGSIRHVEINSNVLWGDDAFLHTRCFTRDVTDRKAADDLARRLADIVENSDDAIISQDLNGIIRSWNLAAQRMYGYTAGEAIGQSIQLTIPADRKHEEAEVVRRVRNGERVPPFDTIRRRQDGTSIPVAITVSPIREREGHIVGASKIIRDISSRKRLETRDRFLVELDDTVRPLTDAEAITFSAAKALGEHLEVNRCAYATVEDDEDAFVLTGNYTNGVDSIVGRYTFTQFGQECLRLMRAGEPYVVADSETDPRVTTTERPSYQVTAIRAVVCVPILKQGKFVAAMAVHSAAPRQWERDEVELVQRVASRSWESIERARVTQELRAANRAKDEFLAMLGHELRNPLSPILTALQLMKLRGSDGSERERTVIERQVNHLTRLVDDLLDVSRIARGKVELKEEIVEIAEAVAKAIEITSPLLEQRTHTLNVAVPRRGLFVKGDPTRLTQVISNLLNNAAKYTPPGGHITVAARDEDGDVVLRVRDTGIGIAADVLPRMFDLFVQERQAIDRSQGGLGLGLTIVRNLVERHGGRVAAHSDGPGTGSEFVVRLPQAMTTAALEAHPTNSVGGGRSLAPAPDAMRILVVDDNVDGAEMLATALRAKGYDTRVAHDAPAALRVAADFRPDVAFLDIGLPVMDGYELAARLRKRPDADGTRLIALTGYGQESDRQKTREAGFEHHFVKPVDLESIDALLSRGRENS